MLRSAFLPLSLSLYLHSLSLFLNPLRRSPFSFMYLYHSLLETRGCGGSVQGERMTPTLLCVDPRVLLEEGSQEWEAADDTAGLKVLARRQGNTRKHPTIPITPSSS